MALFILAVIVFVLADLVIRAVAKKRNEKKIREDREGALTESLKLDFSREAKTLKRAEVQNPKARILCVDDEQVILDSFRKILVLDGYSVDTVEAGVEALGLIQQHNYDFLFTDLKMPSMSGEDVAKSAKHLRPDIDVIVITGYATVESAVECMKHGVMDYIQKPFTEAELTELVKKFVYRRQERIEKELKPRVHISHISELSSFPAAEFVIPGGAFISEGHCWLTLEVDGTVKVGIDDFAKKLLGKIDDIEYPNLGMKVKAGQSLFSIRLGKRTMAFEAPISGQVTKINKYLGEHLESLDVTPYGQNWICTIDADDFDGELGKLKIGKSAVSFYQTEIDRFLASVKDSLRAGANAEEIAREQLHVGHMESLEDNEWNEVANKFFRH
ncbi:MAG: response regulator [Bacteroidota bacterium]|jgi:CheY-like chemotaxis protein/glycine cleavage system H lipoate-binding protein